MTIDEYSSRINGVITDLEGGIFSTIMVALANDAIAMIKSRVVNTGKNAKGEPFKPYSKGYLNYKKSLGRYRGFVDFSLTTRMWSSIKLFSSPDQLQKGIAKITATTTAEQEKLEENTALRGAIIELSDNELQMLYEEYQQMLLDIFRKNRLL